MPAAKLAEQVRAMLGAQPPSKSTKKATTTQQRGKIALFEEIRTNEIVVVGTPSQVQEALTLLKRFDISLGLVTQVYRFKHIQAERFHKLAQTGHWSIQTSPMWSSRHIGNPFSSARACLAPHPGQ